MMKNNNILRFVGAVALVAMTLTSCNKFLDKNPDNRAEINSPEKIAALLTSAYPTTTFAEITEMYSDNVDKQLTPTYSVMSKLEEEAALWKDITYKEDGGDEPYSLWNACYMAAAHANTALEAIAELGNTPDLQGMKGEALVCRAYAHWILANVFCMPYSPLTKDTELGITYMDHSETDLNPKYERGTLGQTYDAIAADLEAALPIMDDSHIKVLKYHFNRKAAYAFATRFYLQYTQEDKSNYDKAIEYANVVIGASAKAAVRDWTTIGAKDINNQVRAMAFTDVADPANLLNISVYSQWPVVHGPFSRGYKYCHDNVIANNETCAANPWGSKSTLKFRIPQYSGMPKVIMAKLAYYFEYTDVVNGIGFAHSMIPAFTTDEVVINRAEALIMKGEYEAAADDLNAWGTTFYNSASNQTAEQISSFYENMEYYDPYKPTAKKALNPDYEIEEGMQENMIHAVLSARRILFLHEGLRLFDVKRFGIEMYRRGILDAAVQEVIDFMPKNDPRRAIQLPQSVINAGLTPNPRNVN